MSSRIRNLISSKIADSLTGQSTSRTSFQNAIGAALFLKNVAPNRPTLQLNQGKLKYLIKQHTEPSGEPKGFVSQILNTRFDSSFIDAIKDEQGHLVFELNNNNFLREVVVGQAQDATKVLDESRENIIVEFSSPNIAKPFHFGHLRSTIIGNFVSNIFAAYGHNVIRINYLGDWGTQFGYLKLGMDMANLTDEEVEKDPIRHLFNAYVRANQLGEQDEKFAKQARVVFNQMENGEMPDLEAWQRYRKYTVNELERVYERLGIRFDEYAWESSYRKVNILPILEQMRNSGLLIRDDDGMESFELANGTKVPIVKSDGSTLYLTRDIAAIIDRQERYRFDRMYYVVGNEQHSHFNALFQIAKKLNVRNAEQLHHIKFGKVEGMSTRKGKVVFLSDVLDEMRDLTIEKQLQSEFTRVDINVDQETADIDAISSIIVFELQRNRQGSYAFDMNEILRDANARGKNFQITHCRLCSLENSTAVTAAECCDPEALLETEAFDLAFEIARLPDILYKCKETVSAQNLLTYMFSLNTKIGKALHRLNIKNEQSADVRAQRMLLFVSARHTLAHCMKIIGLKPLERM